jgi:signal transduction histidine kinase
LYGSGGNAGQTAAVGTLLPADRHPGGEHRRAWPVRRPSGTRERITTRAISEDSLHERLAVPGPGDELKDRGDTIDRLLQRLEAAFDAQRRFAANASHELRTPLAMMRTSLDVATAKPGPIPPEVTVLAGKIREGLDQTDRLLESLLLLARAQHGARREPCRESAGRPGWRAVILPGTGRSYDIRPAMGCICVG